MEDFHKAWESCTALGVSCMGSYKIPFRGMGSYEIPF